jgi:hypothetical protein
MRDVEAHVDHQEIGAVAFAKRREGGFDIGRERHLRAAIHGDLCGGRQLAAKPAYDQ